MRSELTVVSLKKQNCGASRRNPYPDGTGQGLTRTGLAGQTMDEAVWKAFQHGDFDDMLDKLAVTTMNFRHPITEICE